MIKYIFFDCMETLIDLYELPSRSDYGRWAFQGSGVETYWRNLEEFLMLYEASKVHIAGKMMPDQDSGIELRHEYVVRHSTSIPENMQEVVVERLNKTYWSNYQAQCYVKPEVKQILPMLAQRCKLAVVSNFKVYNGIEELLEAHGIRQHFEFVTTSIREGWRKPHLRIYQAAMARAGCDAREIVFIGDDFENDYVMPKKIGMEVILLEKGRSTPISVVTASFEQLVQRIDEMVRT